jgi:O-antigen/teichoic acid export membrane protein
MMVSERQMETSTEQPKSAMPELQRRHKATATTVRVLLILTVLLSVIAFLINSSIPPRNNPSLDIAVRITILVFGLGAITLRRTKFATMRLQDIGALKGASGLLITFQRTTLQVAVLGAVIAVVGFVATLVTANAFYAYGAGLVALAVLLYCYPVRSSWEKAIKRFAPGPQSN